MTTDVAQMSTPDRRRADVWRVDGEVRSLGRGR
jgi:hypothetical protein